jgi:hypothetical protein
VPQIQAQDEPIDEKSLQNQQSRMRKKNLLSLKNQQNLVKMKEEPMRSPQS